MDRHPLQLVVSGTVAVLRHRLARLEPLTAVAGVGLAAAVGAAAVWLTLALSRDYSQGIEAWDTADESWYVVFAVAWLAGLGLSVAPRCLRRPLGRTCRRLSLAGVILCGLLVAASPLVFLIMLFTVVP